MRIVLATPLYPPEIAGAAAYTKELARRLSMHHEVTVVAYTHLPEELAGVKVIAVDKHQPRFARLRTFRDVLRKTARDTDVIIAVNGASVELPLLLRNPVPFILCIADKTAHKRSRLLENITSIRARAVIKDIPGSKPEILPFEPEPTHALAAWDGAWQKHIHTLEQILNHGN
ncbi:MAG: hypothetical protein B7X04_00540 [Parcubacteria group bacterium 21-54-25]|nr:MAG: hypothetical protein B7X04_00540 [Parcubacteria group bacterium 21-54-25]HQU07458.1 hypothetical protein [Candidatus Paceibacterota bacterium]